MTADPTPLRQQIHFAHRRSTDTEWCLEEHCEHRHWTSGSVPTHKRGRACPPMPTLEDAVLPIIAAEVRKAQADALRDAAGDIVWSAETLPDMTPHDAARGLVRRADRIEKEN